MNNYENFTYTPATLLCDFYKLCHRNAYPTKTTQIYSTFTPRSKKYLPMADGALVFGVQAVAKEYFINYFNACFFNRPKEDVVNEYVFYITHTLGAESADATHIAALHDLGYLPIRMRSLKEGTIAPIQVPVLTIENTHPDFAWLTNYLETLISCQLWQPITSATISHSFRKLLEKHAIKTTGSIEGVDFQAHDFSMRGMSSVETAKLSGAGHLLSFLGTDTFPAITFLEQYYNTSVAKELVGTSVNATEHSVMCANTPGDGDRDEFESYKRLITKVFPKGIVSIVSDTYDFWRNVTYVIPKLKNEIMNRDGKVVIRPDSGNPFEILCGKDIKDYTNAAYCDTIEDVIELIKDDVSENAQDACGDGCHGNSDYTRTFKFNDEYLKLTIVVEYNRHDKRFYFVENTKVVSCEPFTPDAEDIGLVEYLWNTFGGTTNEKGYKVLDSHIGAIYGESINYELAEKICNMLAEKGFASTNVTFGLGSFTFQHNTRDSLGFAMKATSSIVGGKEILLFKDPKTDQGKKSQRGRVYVSKDAEGNYVAQDGFTQVTLAEEELKKPNELEIIFENGKMVKETSLAEIRERVATYR